MLLGEPAREHLLSWPTSKPDAFIFIAQASEKFNDIVENTLVLPIPL
jgi:hypothetical protein